MYNVLLSYSKEGEDNLYDNYLTWKCDYIKPIGLMKKIVLKTDETTLRNIASLLSLKNIKCYEVYDLGLTQIENGSFTCLCIEPMGEEITNKMFGHLKLL